MFARVVLAFAQCGYLLFGGANLAFLTIPISMSVTNAPCYSSASSRGSGGNCFVPSSPNFSLSEFLFLPEKKFLPKVRNPPFWPFVGEFRGKNEI